MECAEGEGSFRFSDLGKILYSQRRMIRLNCVILYI